MNSRKRILEEIGSSRYYIESYPYLLLSNSNTTIPILLPSAGERIPPKSGRGSLTSQKAAFNSVLTILAKITRLNRP